MARAPRPARMTASGPAYRAPPPPPPPAAADASLNAPALREHLWGFSERLGVTVELLTDRLYWYVTPGHEQLERTSLPPASAPGAAAAPAHAGVYVRVPQGTCLETVIAGMGVRQDSAKPLRLRLLSWDPHSRSHVLVWGA